MDEELSLFEWARLWAERPAKHSASMSGLTTFGKRPAKTGVGSEFSASGRRIHGITPAVRPVRAPKTPAAPKPAAGSPALSRTLLPLTPAAVRLPRPKTSGIFGPTQPPVPPTEMQKAWGAFGQGVKRAVGAPWRMIPRKFKLLAGGGLALAGLGVGVGAGKAHQAIQNERAFRRDTSALSRGQASLQSSLWSPGTETYQSPFGG